MANLVLEGGGVKGIALAGAVKAMEQRLYAPYRMVGTSAGAIVVALLAAGYSADELNDIISGPEIARFTDVSALSHVPIVGRTIGAAYNLLRYQGLYRGDYFYEFIREKLLDKGVSTFCDLVLPGASGIEDPRHRYRAHMIAADITRGRMLILPDDINVERYGIAPDELEVALAVRMSMSIPYFFRPVTAIGKNNTVSRIVDGGLLSNFPVWYFDEGRDAAGPTTGMLTMGIRILRGRYHEIGFPYLGRTLYALASTVLEANDISATTRFMRLEYARQIYIDTANVGIANFGLSSLQKEVLFESGYQTMLAYLDAWNKDIRGGEVSSAVPEGTSRSDTVMPASPLR
ncbi:MAG TPA: patatin-like phospholipase family protein [Sorangium sp.]|uniref:patatin-like phospholipase family protein n=1 Tax=Sorangium sp. So ce388 TaxID=3133309 RepID=UPI002B8D135A|nr:patatin-like phospholipase family protein [Sorangium sp.]